MPVLNYCQTQYLWNGIVTDFIQLAQPNNGDVAVVDLVMLTPHCVKHDPRRVKFFSISVQVYHWGVKITRVQCTDAYIRVGY